MLMAFKMWWHLDVHRIVFGIIIRNSQVNIVPDFPREEFAMKMFYLEQ